ncbi:hypothetical protein OROMI_024240 [Orobanche minor]
MSEIFSATLRIGDLNDYIAPSQGCVIKTESSGKSRIAPKMFQTEPVKISLKDCLAYSGCITSAETVMLEKQSLDEFLSNLNKGKAIVVSLSPQSKASLDVHFSLSPLQICYAEKTLGSYILPHISSVKSPQQTIGAAIKNHIYQELCIRPEDIYHVTVMPCYDTKLEASREDFVFHLDSDAEAITEVDSVLTTGEVLDLIKMKSIDFTALEESPVEKLLSSVDEEGNLYGVPGSSGGYADTIAKMLFKKEIEGPLEYKTIRNADFGEVTLEVEGKIVLRFALCYGFRNLRNVVTKIKSGKCEYHFLEIMACPSGCLSGGGQIKPNPGQSPKDFIQSLEATYSKNVLVADPFENHRTRSLYTDWLGEPSSEKAKRYLHTEYHPVVKSISSLLQNW